MQTGEPLRSDWIEEDSVEPRLALLEERVGADVGLASLLGEIEALGGEDQERFSQGQRDRLDGVRAMALGKSGRWKECSAVLEPLLRRLPETAPSRTRAQLLNLQGVVLRHQGQNGAAYALFREAERLWESVDDGSGVARALINQANVHADGGDFGSAVTLHERALEQLDPAVEPVLYARLLLNTAHDHHATGNEAVAFELTQRAMPLIEASAEDSRLRVEYCVLVGQLRLAQGEMAEAAEEFSRGLRRADSIGDRHLIGTAQMGLGRVHAALRRWEESEAAFDEAGRVFAEMGNERGLAQLELHRGEALLARGDLPGAREALVGALHRAQRMDSAEQVFQARRALSATEKAAGRSEAALTHLESALEAHQRASAERCRNQRSLLRVRLESMQEQHVRQLEQAEKRRLEDDNLVLHEANDRLERLVFERRELLSIVAHDLRGPLSTVVSTADLAGTTPELGERELRQFLANLGQTAEDALELLDHLLNLERLDSALLTTRSTTVRLGSLLNAELVRVLRQARQKGIEIVSQSESPALSVFTDGKILSQIINNFLTNAIKYSPGGTRVCASATTVGGGAEVEIAVADEGPGISPEKRDRLFTRFYLAGSVPTGGESSTGLGLYLVRRYAALLGGTVGFRPRSPVGSVFFLRLPVGH